MLVELIKDKVYFRIFDKTYQESSHAYAKYKASDATKIAIIEKNRQAILSSLEAQKILILNQVHGTNIIDADQLDDYDLEPIADASITMQQNLALAIQTADCVPLLLSSDTGEVIGAAHCGWRSVKNNIISKLVSLMHAKGADKIKAVLGPSIQQPSYEVDQKFYSDFLQDHPSAIKFFISSSNTDHYLFDLSSFVISRLNEEGIYDILNINEDTYSIPEKYPSYRRSYHTGEIYNQNILSTILIK